LTIDWPGQTGLTIGGFRWAPSSFESVDCTVFPSACLDVCSCLHLLTRFQKTVSTIRYIYFLSVHIIRSYVHFFPLVYRICSTGIYIVRHS
jgi:hypothetical protein